MLTSLTFWSFARRLSRRSIRSLAPFVSGPWTISWVTFRTNSFCVLSGLCVLICLVLPLSRPQTLFVSPRSPSRSLSKNILSFFLRDVISRAYSSSSSHASSSDPSSSASAPSSSRAHSVRGVATSWAFARNASLSSVLAAALWSSSSVFTSVLWWPLVQWCRLFVVLFLFPVCSFCYSWEWVPLGGRVLTLRRCSSVSSLRRRIPSVVFWCPVVSWSGKFPIERCYLWGWKLVATVGVACPVCAVFSLGARCDLQLAVGRWRPWLDGGFLLDVTGSAELGLSFLTDRWNVLIRPCSGLPASVPTVRSGGSSCW